LPVFAEIAQAASLSRSELALLRAMNEARRAHGLAPLRIDTRLERTSRAHSAARIRRAGVRAPRVGENLAWAVGAMTEAHAIVNVWLASPEHRANLLRPGYRTVGVGIRIGSFEGYAGASVVTTDFAGR
jgi:uncharacterized protein YkwD